MANDNGSGFVLGLFVGGVIGCAVGMLLAPKAGSETRSDLRELGDNWRTRADEMAADLRSRGAAEFDSMSERVGPAVDSLRERSASTIGAVRDAGSGAVTSAREGVDVVRAKIGLGDGHEAASPNGEASEEPQTGVTS